MPQAPPNLGKLLAVHVTAPTYIQRAAVVAILAFLFFVVMLVAFLIRQHFMYLILAAAFFVVSIFTLIGFMMQRRNVLKLYQNGIAYKKLRVLWSDISAIDGDAKTGLKITIGGDNKFEIPASLDGFDTIAAHIRQHTSTY